MDLESHSQHLDFQMGPKPMQVPTAKLGGMDLEPQSQHLNVQMGSKPMQVPTAKLELKSRSAKLQATTLHRVPGLLVKTSATERQELPTEHQELPTERQLKSAKLEPIPQGASCNCH